MAQYQNINEHMANLDIEEEENKSFVFDGDVEEEANRYELCLVGGIFTEKIITRE